MSSEMNSSEDELFLTESVFPKVLVQKKVAIHEVNKGRSVYGEYHHLFGELKEDNDRFFKYLRMSLETFNYILSKIDHRLQKQWCNLHQQPILPEERLVITLR